MDERSIRSKYVTLVYGQIDIEDTTTEFYYYTVYAKCPITKYINLNGRYARIEDNVNSSTISVGVDVKENVTLKVEGRYDDYFEVGTETKSGAIDIVVKF